MSALGRSSSCANHVWNRSGILQAIETEVKNAGGHNMIWIRGSPGVGKSALAASISTQLQEQNRHVMSFWFDRTQSTAITTDSLWCVVACILPFADTWLNIIMSIALFKKLIEMPLSSLDDVPCGELTVIVIDALDECGGLRHDSSAMDNYEGLLRMLKHWVQADYLKMFKLVITS